MNDVTDCFILGQTDYQENSLLINALTSKYGKLSFVATGVKKNSSKNASGILLYTNSKFMFDYQPNKTIFRLKSATLNKYYRNMHENIEGIAAISLISEASDHIILQECDLELQNEIYSLLLDACSLLDKKINTKIVVSIFITKLLQLFGIGMEVDHCVLCGSTIVSSFSIKDGGFECASCANKNHNALMNKDTLKALRYINKANLTQYHLVEESIDTHSIPLNLIIDFYEMHVGYKLKSFSFYERFCH